MFMHKKSQSTSYNKTIYSSAMHYHIEIICDIEIICENMGGYAISALILQICAYKQCI